MDTTIIDAREVHAGTIVRDDTGAAVYFDEVTHVERAGRDVVISMRDISDDSRRTVMVRQSTPVEVVSTCRECGNAAFGYHFPC